MLVTLDFDSACNEATVRVNGECVDPPAPELCQADDQGTGDQVQYGGGTQLDPPPVDTPLLYSQGNGHLRGSEQ